MIVTVIATGFDGDKNTAAPAAAEEKTEQETAAQDTDDGDDEDLSLGLLSFFKNKSDYDELILLFCAHLLECALFVCKKSASAQGIDCRFAQGIDCYFT